ncbi:MAG TPA: hypothetical protein ENJ82_00605, partial [Bacteroidetes bacterium]|nr:hypothetical protein [Bacteroidota bacterium]
MPKGSAYSNDSISLSQKLIYPFSSLGYFFLGLMGVSFFISLVFLQGYESILALLANGFWAFMIAITQWVGHVFISIQIEQRVSWKESPWTRAILAVLTMTVYTLFAFFVVQTAMILLFYGALPDDFWEWVIRSGKLPLVISFIIGWSLAGRSFYRNWLSSEREAQAFKAEMLNYRYEAL